MASGAGGQCYGEEGQAVPAHTRARLPQPCGRKGGRVWQWQRPRAGGMWCSGSDTHKLVVLFNRSWPYIIRNNKIRALKGIFHEAFTLI